MFSTPPTPHAPASATASENSDRAGDPEDSDALSEANLTDFDNIGNEDAAELEDDQKSLQQEPGDTEKTKDPEVLLDAPEPKDPEPRGRRRKRQCRGQGGRSADLYLDRRTGRLRDGRLTSSRDASASHGER